MSRISAFVATAAPVACVFAGLTFAAEQSILGKSFSVQDREPGVDPTKRKISVSGLEKNSPGTVVGDPTRMGSPGGAVLLLVANGAHSSTQTFMLAQGTTAAGKPFWAGNATKGFTYKDPKGEQGAVKSVSIKRSSRGTFSVKVAVSGKGGSVSVLPPDPGTDGCAALTLGQTTGAGDRYSLLFGPESKIKNAGDEFFGVKTPTAKGTCLTTTSTTTTLPSQCGDGPFPTCGGACPSGYECGAIQGAVPQQCTCFPAGSVCGPGGSGVVCDPGTQDCEQLVEAYALSLAGPCPTGSICTTSVAHVFVCGPTLVDLCIVVEGMCVP